ncbi:TTL5 protein [Gonium pectorale]|uniref:Tubulin--tyrosine ligase-like protein 5 n=1 Tax=Gonium pectorale TaxID=33097 RepID=A0A150GTQ9_GONPE|nr:TTL5 protein [Gonium pectorale]|eukprot:KXZ53247.1 TTL5 protein [Gonium pectorale]
MCTCAQRRLPATLKEALGEALAWDIVPHSFSLPEELQLLAAHAAAIRERLPGSSGPRGNPTELWILKTAQHLGKGLKLVPLDTVALEAGRTRRRPTQKPYVLAQRYVDRPLLVEGRKFGIRVWVAVTGFNPLRAYLHANGLVLFSTHGYDSKTWRTEAGEVALGHVTNYAQNMDGRVWDLRQLEEHMGAEAYGKMWSKVQRNSALVIAAALQHIKADHEAMKAQSGMTCELVGLDYLIDADLHPWLLEVNGTPSLQVEHEDAQVEQLIHEQKFGMVQDLMTLLGIRDRFKPRYAALRAAAKAKQQAISAAVAAAAAAGSDTLAAAMASASAAAAAKPSATLTRKFREQMQPTSDAGVMARVAAELTNRGRFEPLMPLMPLELATVPWDPRDHELRRLMDTPVSSWSLPSSPFGAGASSANGEAEGAEEAAADAGKGRQSRGGPGEADGDDAMCEGKAAADAYVGLRQSGDDDMGSLVLAIASELLRTELQPAFRASFTDPFEVSNKLCETVMLRDGCDVCCTSEQDRERIERVNQIVSSGSMSP